MKNSIFKSYTKKILRSEAFISVIIVFVLALGIIGTSYALYMDVDKDTDYQLVESGDLKISFSGSDTITLNMLPQEDNVATNLSDNLFTFNIYNTGTYDADYKIKLIATTGDNYVSTEYINYQLCKTACAEDTPINTLSNIDDTIIEVDSIRTTDAGHDYILRVWINNAYPGTKEQTLQVKIVVEASNAEEKLVDLVMNDTRITKNQGTPNFSETEENEVGMYSAEDDYGTSWYFRGAQSYNYVNFAGFPWRIVRINGDGSIRLILDGTLDSVYRKNEDGTTSSTPAGTTSNFNALQNDNAYLGYMYGSFETNSTSYDEAHRNEVDSVIKTTIDTFYESYFENKDNNYHYGKYLADTLFCGDKTISGNPNTTDATNLGFGTSNTEYAGFGKMEADNGFISLECAKNADNNYSRYTAESRKTPKGIEVNNDLDYPIALLSGDEFVMAGAALVRGNTEFYLYNNITSKWWLMTPYYYTSVARVMLHNGDGEVSSYRVFRSSGYGVRPVINLKNSVLISSGDGTVSTPYEIKEY